ncbi:uncharacterized protein LOC132057909 [Lycium ferocissimum]|uniref:uncharacterized protein LOC132057909 n=1 Tax=Lycium ferocissimum TaxID=112874 RepID=UPI0028160378|nr:uncharacterized protein LOC132057909 [Lycium ferocissimum]
MASVGKLVLMLVTNKEMLCVKWIHEVYMKEDADFWVYTPSNDCSWSWKNMNKIKLGMEQWYNDDAVFEVHELVWSRLLLPKHRSILWLATQRKLLTKERMVGIGITCDTAECVLCDQEEMEDLNHLFAECDWVRDVWREVMQWLGIQAPHLEPRLVLEFIKKKHWCKMKKEVVVVVHGALIYFTWQARNWKIFKDNIVDTSFVVQQIEVVVKERIDSSSLGLVYSGSTRRRIGMELI